MLITMNDSRLLPKFAKKFDIDNFNFILVSKNIKNTGDFKNVSSLVSLMPPPQIMHEYINGDISKFRERYFSYLTTPICSSLIAVLVKLLVEKSNVVILCSEEEKEYGYIKMISQYIEKVYGIDSMKAKEYIKNPNDELLADKLDRTKEILKEKLAQIKPEHLSNTIPIKRKAMKKKLKDATKDELIQMCEDRHIKVKKKARKDKKELIKLIVDFVCGDE